MCVKTSGSKCFHCAKCVHGVSCLRSWITHDYAVAKDYQCIGANQWSISGPSVVQALQRFWASTARDSSKEAQLRRCEGVFGTSQSSCWTQVFVVACVSAHLEIYICMPRICIHTYVHITAIKSNMAVMNQRQHPSPCHQGFLDSAASFTQQPCAKLPARRGSLSGKEIMQEIPWITGAAVSDGSQPLRREPLLHLWSKLPCTTATGNCLSHCVV